MPSSPHGEQEFTLGKGKRLPGSPCRRTLQRWIKEGRLSRTTGKVVKLEAWQIGGRWYTSVEAFDRFLLRLKGEME